MIHSYEAQHGRKRHGNLSFWLFVLAGLILLTACQPAPALEIIPSGTLALSVEAPDIKISTSQPTSLEGGQADADVLYVRAIQDANGTWTFYVTVQHPDKGWEDYADGWDVLTLDGAVIKSSSDSPFTRLLTHPHEDEQPFTRSQSGIAIPPNVNQVRVRAHDLVDGFGGREVVVDLSVDSGADFEVVRNP